MDSAQNNKPAFRPRDILTIPNAMSALGATMAWRGAENIETPRGLLQTIAGRVMDALDGPVARATGQESNFGATVDAGLDKVATAKIMYEMWRKNAAPSAVLGGIATLSAINTATTAYTMITRPGEPIRPTKTGKLAMAGETLALFAYTTAHTAEHSGHEKASRTLRRVGRAAFIATLPLAAHATRSYIERARKQ